MSEPTQLTQFSPKIFNYSIFVMSSNYVCTYAKKGRNFSVLACAGCKSFIPTYEKLLPFLLWDSPIY